MCVFHGYGMECLLLIRAIHIICSWNVVLSTLPLPVLRKCRSAEEIAGTAFAEGRERSPQDPERITHIHPFLHPNYLHDRKLQRTAPCLRLDRAQDNSPSIFWSIQAVSLYAGPFREE